MDDKLPISVLLLARDETRELAALLPALAFAREIVVVWDRGGDPAARETAARGGARVYERALEGFGAQRQFALERCTQPWVLWIDADERPGPAVADRLRAELAAPPAGASFEFLRRGFFLGRRIRWCGWRDEHVLRLFPREGSRFDTALVHERLMPAGSGRRRHGELTLDHHSYDTWAACVAKLTRYAAAGAEQAFRAGRRAGPLDVLVRPPLRFLRQYGLQLGVLDGAHGLVLCALAATQVFLKYAELWSRTRAAAGGPR